jgi:tryptophanyl-tRNA synthetase
LGAIQNWKKMQEDYDSIFFLVDLHALTVRQNPQTLRERSLEQIALLIACGIDPEKSLLFIQSHVPAHAELAWVLNCYTMMGDLNRMTQFKDKSEKNKKNVNAGLFTYPVLMASDILLYQTEVVPVGHDQLQHIELAREVASRFNQAYGETFRIPNSWIPEVGARIMSLQDPTRKMDKSDPNPNNYIALLDPPALIEKKISRAVTDSGDTVEFVPAVKPGLANLMTIYAALTTASMTDIEKEFAGKKYGHFKQALTARLKDLLLPIQKQYEALLSNPGFLNNVLADHAKRASERAAKTLSDVYSKIGLVPRGF